MAWVSLPSPSMTPNKKKSARRSRVKKPRRGIPEEDLQGPPAAETIVLHDDRALQAEEHLAVYGRATSPRLTGGDPDADWERADHVGEEAVGGSVATPDKNVVDELGSALGVPRGPDEEVRTSEEILEDRDQHRWEQER
ncbi:MAG TPA: DUF6335 family protein [Methylomirabilota bacterium]|nr:DUF6335 family protein [Methylomirabilota bacterium]